MLASELWAASHGTECKGEDECHWCGARCPRMIPHDDPIPQIGVMRLPSRRPGNSYICIGCQLFRRTRTTIHILGGGYLDRKSPINHSWIITRKFSLVVDPKELNPQGRQDLYDILLNPPPDFTLALLDADQDKPMPLNYLQLMVANEISRIEADTPIAFTINGILHHYCVYELEQATKQLNGKMPGVRALIKIFGLPDKTRTPEPAPKKKGAGRPAPKEDGRVSKKVLYLSGVTPIPV